MSKGDIVKTHLGGTGVIVRVKGLLWGFKYVVRMTETSLFYTKGDVEDFKEDQLKVCTPQQ